jgi:hemoglobin/transferrin/lactoferrin receptor protein
MCGFFSSFSQTIRVFTVAESDTIPIIHAAIQNSNGSTCYTDRQGVCDLPVSITDRYFIHHLSFKSDTITGQELVENNGRIRMHRSTFEVEGAVILPGQRLLQDPLNDVQRVGSNQIQLELPSTTADIAQSNPGVFVQKSQQGGGSFMMRGFSANRVLISVDGVVMNNAIFRSGNVHQIIAVDPYNIEYFDVAMGAASTLYGSGAIGGAVAIQSKRASTSDSSSYTESGGLVKFNSANRENTVRLNFSFHGEKIGSRTLVGVSRFSDLKMGSNGSDQLLRPYYQKRTEEGDIAVVNPDPERQLFTQYSQFNLAQSFAIPIGKHWNSTIQILGSLTSDIPRYDRLIQQRDSQFRFGNWRYGPQDWLMTTAEFTQSSGRVFDQLRILPSYQRYKESRINRRFGDTSEFYNLEDLHIFGFNLDAEKSLYRNILLLTGMEGRYQIVNSNGYVKDIKTGDVSEAPSRYPGLSNSTEAGFYAMVRWAISGRTQVEGGIRGNWTSITSDSILRGTGADLALDQQYQAITGSFSVVHRLNRAHRIEFHGGTGFRAPNVDDLSKVFDSRPGRVILPNTNLKPERSLYGSIHHRLRSRQFRWETEVFINWLNGGIGLDVEALSNRDSIVYQGELSQIERLTNYERMTVYGIQSNMEYRFTNHWTILGGLTYQQGETNQGFSLRHLPPTQLNASVKYQLNTWLFQATFTYSDGFESDELSPSESAKPHLYLMDSNGDLYSPSWYTLDLSIRKPIQDKGNVIVRGLNLTDQRYRPYSSGIVAPGRAIEVALSWNL